MTEDGERDPSSPAGTARRSLAAAILLSPVLLIGSCTGGFFGGAWLGAALETRDGGRREISGDTVPHRFFVLVQNADTDDVEVHNAGGQRLQVLVSTVAADPRRAFLLHRRAGDLHPAGGGIESGRYAVEALAGQRQRIVFHWDDGDDLSGVSTYVARLDDVEPERHGIVGPALVVLGVTLGIGLPMTLSAAGRRARYLASDPATRRPVRHWLGLCLVGLPGGLLVLMALRQLVNMI